MLVNLVAGVVAVAVAVIVAVALGQLICDTCTAIGGATLWCKFFAGYSLSRHAHPSRARRKT